jgi:hypothetical protein
MVNHGDCADVFGMSFYILCASRIKFTATTTIALECSATGGLS